MFDDFDVRQKLRDLAERAKAVHANERQVHLESVALVGEIDRRNAAVNMGLEMVNVGEGCKFATLFG